MTTQPQPNKKLLENIVYWAGGIITILTLLFLVLPNLQPQPSPDLDAEISAIEIERDVTYETYLLRNQLSPPSNFTCKELQSNGIIIKPALKLIGLQGKTLQVRWSMYGAKSKRLIPSDLYLEELIIPISEYIPENQSDIRIFEYWLPSPQIEGELYIHLELLLKDKDGFRPLTYKDTESFTVSVIPECSNPVLSLSDLSNLASSTSIGPTMTVSPLPIYTSTVMPIQTTTAAPIPASDIILEDSFLNNRSGWLIVTPEPFGPRYESKILASRYLHLIECPLSHPLDYCSYYFFLPRTYRENYGIYFDATIEQLTVLPNTDVIIGVQFRKSLENYYAAYFRSSGAYSLGMVLNGSVGILKEDQMGEIYNSEVGSTNRFGIVADHALLSVYINEHKLTTVEDGNITWAGNAFFAISVPKGGTATISFDNVLVRQIK